MSSLSRNIAVTVLVLVTISVSVLYIFYSASISHNITTSEQKTVEGRLKNFTFPYYREGSTEVAWTVRGAKADYYKDNSVTIYNPRLEVRGRTGLSVRADQAFLSPDKETALLKGNTRVYVENGHVIFATMLVWRGKEERFNIPGKIRVAGKELSISGSELYGWIPGKYYRLEKHRRTAIDTRLFTKKMDKKSSIAKIDTTGKTIVTSRGSVEYVGKQNQFIYKQAVRVENNNGVLNCDKLSLLFDETMQRILKLTARGNVRFLASPNDFRAASELVEVFADTGKIIIKKTGKVAPVVYINKRKSVADKFVYDTETGFLEVINVKSTTE